MKEIFLVELSSTGKHPWSSMGAFETEEEAQKAVVSQRKKVTGWFFRKRPVTLYKTLEEAKRS
jgi:hypothetical protein